MLLFGDSVDDEASGGVGAVVFLRCRVPDHGKLIGNRENTGPLLEGSGDVLGIDADETAPAGYLLLTGDIECRAGVAFVFDLADAALKEVGCLWIAAVCWRDLDGGAILTRGITDLLNVGRDSVPLLDWTRMVRIATGLKCFP